MSEQRIDPGAAPRRGPSGSWIWPLSLLVATFALLPLRDPDGGSLVALWPSVVAIGLAFVTRQIHGSLAAGAFAGALLLAGGNPFAAFLSLFEDHLLPALANPWNLSVLAFTLLMGGFVELLDRGGGMLALARRVLGRQRERGAGARRRAGLTVYALGWLFFVDGLANSMLIGKAMRGVADRARLSREKLAFLVDSTSSPIAGLALVSTWVAYELSVIRDGLAASVVSEAAAPAPFLVLVWSLPHRYYNLFLLWVVLLVVVLGRDLGPMARAEARALRPRHEPPGADRAGSAATAASAPPASGAWRALLPLGVLLAGVILGLFGDGGGFSRPLTLDSAVAALGDANAALVFVWATAFAALVAMVVWRPPAAGSGEPGGAIFLRGMEGMFVPSLILVFAWTLNSVLAALGAGGAAVALLGDALPAALLPVVVFVLAAGVSFATGTSWGTMALVMPLVIPLAVAAAGPGSLAGPGSVLAVTVGSVLAGAVFGDHCSPISDTTLVSALASGCEPMEHVRTQVPYALGAAAIAATLGYLPAGAGVAPWLLLPVGGAVCFAWIRWAGRSPNEDSPNDPESDARPLRMDPPRSTT